MASIFSGVNNPGLDFEQFTALEVQVLEEIAGLTPPGADRILFWDDSANSYAYLTAGSGLTITGTTLTASASGTAIGGTITGGTSGSVLFVGASNDLQQDNSNLFWNNTLKKLSVGTVVAAANTLSVNQTSAGAQVVSSQFQSQFAFAAGSNNQCLNFLTDDTGTNSTSTIVGINGIAQKSGTSGTVSSLTGMAANARVTSGGTATAARGAIFALRSTGGSTITTGYGVTVNSPIITGVGSTIGISYGVQVSAQKVTGVTTGYGVASDGTTDINYFLGQTGMGTNTPNANAILDIVSTTKAFMPPRMTTTQKNAIPSPTEGMMVYDLTLHKLCVYTTAWETVTSI